MWSGPIDRERAEYDDHVRRLSMAQKRNRAGRRQTFAEGMLALIRLLTPTKIGAVDVTIHVPDDVIEREFDRVEFLRWKSSR